MLDIRAFSELKENPKVAPFEVGDTVRVGFTVVEGDRQRVQVFEGIVIRQRNSGPASNFTVRRISHGVGVERTFPRFSPQLEAVGVVRKGQARRSRLYYLRGLSSRATRAKVKARTAR